MTSGPERPHYGSGPVPPGAFAGPPPRPEPIRPDQLADYWRRLVAVVVDGLIVGALAVGVVALIGGGFLGDGDVGVGEVIVGLLLIVVFFTAIAFLYAPLVMVATNGQTLGKLVTGCRVVRADGRRMDFWYAVLREVLVKGLLLGVAGSLTGGIAYLVDGVWPLVDGQNRALHDYVVDSRVVRA